MPRSCTPAGMSSSRGRSDSLTRDSIRMRRVLVSVPGPEISLLRAHLNGRRTR